MNYDTSTQEGLKNTLHKRVEEYEKAGNKMGLVRLIGGSIEDFRDENPGSHPDERQEQY